MGLPIIGSVLGVLGKLGKGTATATGVAGVAVGGALLTGTDLNETLRLVLELLTALSVLLASFGIGRKAGATLK